MDFSCNCVIDQNHQFLLFLITLCFVISTAMLDVSGSTAHTHVTNALATQQSLVCLIGTTNISLEN